ncbi:MAG: amidohydrolase family protein [Candidatus Sericytochromatia bacterium]|nr:amidohydrolase family protein [Candidatus Sericytochromatia bacterium]
MLAQMKRIDIHVHMVDRGGAGCPCHVSRHMRGSWQFRILDRMLARHGVVDGASWVARLGRWLDEAHEIDMVALFALDGVYHADGTLDHARSPMVIPNDVVLAACQAHAQLLPVISINPDRADAVAELERAGPLAVAMKWLPPMQRFVPDNWRHARFLDLLAELKLPVIAHTGAEHTFPGAVQELGDPTSMTPLLDRGIPVVFAHCGTGSFLHPRADRINAFLALLGRYDHAFGDSSGFTSLVRGRWLSDRRLEAVRDRILHGSDLPVPPIPLALAPWLGVEEAVRLQGVANPLDRDALAKRAMGMPDAAFHLADELLGPVIRRVKGV